MSVPFAISYVFCYGWWEEEVSWIPGTVILAAMATLSRELPRIGLVPCSILVPLAPELMLNSVVVAFVQAGLAPEHWDECLPPVMTLSVRAQRREVYTWDIGMGWFCIIHHDRHRTPLDIWPLSGRPKVHERSFGAGGHSAWGLIAELGLVGIVIVGAILLRVTRSEAGADEICTCLVNETDQRTVRPYKWRDTRAYFRAMEGV